MYASRILLWFLGGLIAIAAWADSSISVYEANRALILQDGFAVIDGVVFSVAKAKSRRGLSDDGAAFSKARLRATANLLIARYQNTEWPERITQAGIQRLKERHLGLTSQQFTVSAVQVLEQHVDDSGRHVVVIGVDQNALNSHSVSFEQLRRDLTARSEREPRDWELAMLALEVADEPDMEAVLNRLLQELARRFHHNYLLLAQRHVGQASTPVSVDPAVLDEDEMEGVTLMNRVALYGLFPLNARIAYLLADGLSKQGYRRPALWAHYTGTQSQVSSLYRDLNLGSLKGDSDFLAYLRRRYGSVE